MKRSEDSPGELRANSKPTNIHILGVPEGEERNRPEETFEEIIAENFPNMGKEIVSHVQAAQGAPSRMSPRRNTPGYTVIKLTEVKDKDKMLKATRGK